MKNYKLTEGGVQDIETTAFIPNDERNNDWREYQNWLKGLDVEGEDLGTGLNTPELQFTPEEIEAQLSQEEIKSNEEKIQVEIRKIAIESLKASGDLPTAYREAHAI